MVGWILCGLLILWYFASISHANRRSINLESYIIFLLMSDGLRADNKAKFQNWISESNANRADELRMKAGQTIQAFANDLAKEGSSLLGSSSLIWNFHKAGSIEIQ